MTEPKRKGAVRISEIPPQILKQLNAGEIESVNLTEWLAINQCTLLQNVLPLLGLTECVAPGLAKLDALRQPSQMRNLPAVAGVLLNALERNKKRENLLASLFSHPSDTVRCWGAYVIGLDQRLILDEKLTALRPLATDHNAGVREIAWMVVRADIEAQLPHAIERLTTWTQEADANLRRFASEATRPRGVWCKHIEALKQNPELAYGILAPLKSDPSKYVRDSVANWLNDASKSQPDWVRAVCTLWVEESPTKETQAIIKRALRTIGNEK